MILMHPETEEASEPVATPRRVEGRHLGRHDPELEARSVLAAHPAASPMRTDWSAVAMLVAERAGVPAVLLALSGEVLLVTPAAERALGWTFDFVGRNWLQHCIPGEGVEEARSLLRRAGIGALRRLDLRIVTAGGVALATFEVSPVGSGEERGLLLVLENVALVPRRETGTDYDYEVFGATAGNFELRSIWRFGQAREQAGGRCYEVLHGRKDPCSACPLALAQPEGSERLVVRPRVPGKVREHEMVSVLETTLELARVAVRRVPLGSLTAIIHARLHELAEQGNLTERERAVLRLLVEGSEIDGIAAELGISARTVKFHQANLLAKLGADSRIDLMRLVL